MTENNPEGADPQLPPSPLHDYTDEPFVPKITINEDKKKKKKKHHQQSKDSSSNNKRKKDHKRPNLDNSSSSSKYAEGEEISTPVGPTTSSPQTSSSEDNDEDGTDGVPAGWAARLGSRGTKPRERSSTFSNDNFPGAGAGYKHNPFSDKPSYCFLTPMEVSPFHSPNTGHSRNLSSVTASTTATITTATTTTTTTTAAIKPLRAHSLRAKEHSRPGIPDFRVCSGVVSPLLMSPQVPAFTASGYDARWSESPSDGSSSKPKASGCFVTVEGITTTTGSNEITTTTETGGGYESHHSNRRNSSSSHHHHHHNNSSHSRGTSAAVGVHSEISPDGEGGGGGGGGTTRTGGNLTLSLTPIEAEEDGEGEAKTKKRKEKKKGGDDNEWKALTAALNARADPMRHVKIWGRTLVRVDPPFSAPKLPKDGMPFAKTFCRVIVKRKREGEAGADGEGVAVGFIERMEPDGSFVKLVDLGAEVTKVMQSWDQTKNRFALVVCTESGSVIIESLPVETSKEWFDIVDKVHKKVMKQ